MRTRKFVVLYRGGWRRKLVDFRRFDEQFCTRFNGRVRGSVLHNLKCLLGDNRSGLRFELRNDRGWEARTVWRKLETPELALS